MVAEPECLIFIFSKEQTEALVDYLKYVDENAFSYKTLHQMKLKK